MTRAASSAFPRFTTYTPYFGGVGAQPAVNAHLIPFFAKAHAARWPSQAGYRNHQAAAVAAQTQGTGTARDVGNLTSHQPIASYALMRAADRTNRIRSENVRRMRNRGDDDTTYHNDPGLPTLGERPSEPQTLTMQQRWEMLQAERTGVAPVANTTHTGPQMVNPADVVTHHEVQDAASRAGQQVLSSSRMGTATAEASELVIPSSVTRWRSSPRFSRL